MRALRETWVELLKTAGQAKVIMLQMPSNALLCIFDGALVLELTGRAPGLVATSASPTCSACPAVKVLAISTTKKNIIRPAPGLAVRQVSLGHQLGVFHAPVAERAGGAWRKDGVARRPAPTTRRPGAG